MFDITQTTPDVYKVDRPLHHQLALKAYKESFYRRNYTERYRKSQLCCLSEVFEKVHINDEVLPGLQRPIDTFDVIKPQLATKFIDACYRDLGKQTRAIACLKAIERYCTFLRSNPTIYLPGQQSIYLPALYGPIDCPVNQYSIPKKSHEGKANWNYLTKTEYKAFLSFTRKRIQPSLSPQKLYQAFQMHTMAVIAGEMGLRLQEILGLELQHVNFLDNVCLVAYGKGHKGSGHRKREVPLSPLVKATLQDFLKQYPRERGKAIFQGQQGVRLSVHTAGRWMRQLLRDIQIARINIVTEPGFGWHALRRTFATHYLERGGNIKDLMLIVGWSFASTASHYLGYSKDQIVQAGIPLYGGEQV